MLEWLKQGEPAHWVWLAGAALLVVEDFIARSPALAANSTIQLVFGLLGRLPGVGIVLGRLGPPRPVNAVSILEVSPKKPKKKLPKPPVAFLLAFLAPLCVGCANPKMVAKAALASGASAYTAAVQAWGVADLEKQRALVDQSASKEAAIAAVNEWRKGPQARVNQALAATGGAFLAARRVLLLVELGQAKAIDLTVAAREALTQLLELREVLAQFGVAIPQIGGF